MSAQTVAWLGLAVYTLGFVVYALRMRQPNPATWGLWAVFGLLNACSYLSLSHDWIQSLQAIGSAVLNVSIALIALFTGKYQPLAKADKLIGLLALAAIAAWWLSGKAAYAQYLVGLAITLSIIPTFRSVHANPDSEPILPWTVIASSYLCSVWVVWAKHGSFEQYFIYVLALILQFSLAGWIIFWKRKKIR